MFVVTMFYCTVPFADFKKNIHSFTLNSVIIGITISHFILMLYYVKYNTQWFETRFIHLVVLYTCTFIISRIFKYQICTNLQDMKNMHWNKKNLHFYFSFKNYNGFSLIFIFFSFKNIHCWLLTKYRYQLLNVFSCMLLV